MFSIFFSFIAGVALSYVGDVVAIFNNCCDTLVLGWVKKKNEKAWLQQVRAPGGADEMTRKLASGEKVASLQHSSVRLKQFSLNSSAAGFSWSLSALLNHPTYSNLLFIVLSSASSWHLWKIITIIIVIIVMMIMITTCVQSCLMGLQKHGPPSVVFQSLLQADFHLYEYD